MKTKKWLSLLCALALFVSLTLTGTVFAAEKEFTVTDNGVYVMEQGINARPVTMEAVIKFPKQSSSGRLGILFGNWVYPVGPHVDYKIESDGNLRIEWGTASGSEKLEFTKVNVFTGEWLHLAVVADVANKKVHCYINGKLVQSLKTSRTSVPNCTNPFAIGNNPRQGNGYNFRGAIKSIAVYNDMRTEEEIAADMQEYGKDGLLAHFDLTGLTQGDTITETVSGQKVEWEQKWFDKREPVGEYDYSFAVLGDPQTVTRVTPENMPKIYQYVADNVESRNIQQVFTLGDLTDTKTGEEEEWETITGAMDILNGKVQHNMVRGNHDFNRYYEEYITIERYGGGVVTKDDTMKTYYRLFEVGHTKYMVMALQYQPTAEERAWASEQIAAHPDRRVIIVTHSYLDTDGKKTDEGKTIWSDVASKHSNVVLVLSGHRPTEDIVKTTTKGVNGNTVTELLVDQQDVDQPLKGGTGLVAFLYFSNNGKHVEVEYYSIFREQYYKMTNQIEFDLDVADEEIVHEYDGDCDATCNVCDFVRDVTVEHTYDNAGDVECNVCGHTREVAQNGWVKTDGKWYFYENGVMVTNKWRKDSKGWVKLGEDGAMLTNKWTTDSKGWCYVGADGYAVTNCWKKDSKGWIYLDANGSMTKSKWILDGGKWYYVDANGYMVSNKWMKDSKGWVKLGADGAMLTNKWTTDSKGWCFVGANGYAVTNCWKKDSTGWIWLNGEGSMTKSKWINDGGKWYYLDNNGYMVAGKSMTIGGKKYTFNASGVCTNP